MRASIKRSLQTMCMTLCLSPAAATRGDEVQPPAPVAEMRNEGWYYQQPTYQPNSKAIIHQKALERSKQRQARLESINWYNASSSRPTVAVLFGSPYFPAWFVPMPGRRPWVEHNSIMVGDGNNYNPVGVTTSRRSYLWSASRRP